MPKPTDNEISSSVLCRLMMNVSRDGIAIIDQEHRLLTCNQSFADMLGYRLDEMQGLRTWDWEAVMNEEQIRHHFKNLSQVNQVFETCHRRKDGSFYDAEVSATGTEIAGSKLIITVTREITARKEVEQQLRFHEVISRSVSDAIIATDLDLNILSWNAAAERVYGWSASEAQGQHIDTLLGTVWYDHQQAQAQKTLLTTGMWKGEVFQKHQNGRSLVIEVSVSFICDINGIPSGGVTINRDITDRKNAENLLRSSEARYRSIVSALPDLIFRINSDFQYTDVQVSTPEMLLVPREKIIGKSLKEILPPNVAELSEKMIRVTLESGDMQIFDYSLEIHGATKAFESRMVPCETGGVLAIVRDVTETRETARRLLESEARFNAIVNDQTELICRFDNNGVLYFVNAAYCAFFNQPAEKLLGQSFFRFLPEKDRDVAKQMFRSLTPEQPVITYYHEVLNAQGQSCWMEWTDRAIFDAQGGLVVYQGVGRDITDRKILEQSLVQASDREQSNLAQELHDGLCQDLKGLEIQAVLLEDKIREQDEDIRTLVATLGEGVNSAARRAYQITKGMITQNLGLEEFPAAIMELAEKETLNSGLRLAVSFENDVLPQNKFQSYHLFRIAQESIKNAVLHSQGTKLEIIWRRDNGQKLLVVRDNGIGIGNTPQSLRGLGMKVMTSRAHSIKADLTVQNCENGGTEVCVRMIYE
jgi:PAS domain S-box-containing protein